MAQRFDFPVISDVNKDGRDAPVGLRDAEVGAPVVREETLFEDRGRWDPDPDPVGSVYLELVKTPNPERVLLTATFEFRSDESVVVKGVVGWDGSEITGGRVAVISGTGKFQGRSGHVRLEVRNPKRWG